MTLHALPHRMKIEPSGAKDANQNAPWRLGGSKSFSEEVISRSPRIW